VRVVWVKNGSTWETNMRENAAPQFNDFPLRVYRSGLFNDFHVRREKNTWDHMISQSWSCS